MMTAELVVEACGAGATVQDGGRIGWRRLGISTAGAMDRLALGAANVLAGNPPDAAAIETALAGARFRLTGAPVLVAVAGPGVLLRVAGRPVAQGWSALAQPDEIIEMSPPRDAVHGYLAVSGGLAVARVMGSRSGHARTGIGPPMLAPGQRLALSPPPAMQPLHLPTGAAHDSGPIRILPGPHDDWFAPGTLEILTGAGWVCDPRSDRMGRFLTGPDLVPCSGSLVSDGAVAGSIQVPPSGQPIVLMRDCQTTAGYPRIATVISADIDRLAQIPTGAAVRFAVVDRGAALRAAARLAAQIAGLCARPFAAPDTGRLLGANLIGGAVDARAEDLP